MAKKHRVSIRLMVEVDPEAWNDEYFTREELPEIRASLRGMVRDGAAEALRHLENTGVVSPVKLVDPL